MQVTVFNAGMPPDSLWIEPAGTWEAILAGHVSPDGKYLSVSTAIRLIADAVEYREVLDWRGSESGTPRATFDTTAARQMHEGEIGSYLERNEAFRGSEDEQADQQLAAELSEFDRQDKIDADALDEFLSDSAERIASEIGDRKLDQQRDNS